MLKNYLIIAVRTLWKSKVYSFLNILGLAVGLAAGILMLAMGTR
jgi:putative ABC transport system permease protein